MIGQVRGLGDSMKAIGYVRVSTEEQAKGGLSLVMQVAKIEKYCAVYDKACRCGRDG